MNWKKEPKVNGSISYYVEVPYGNYFAYAGSIYGRTFHNNIAKGLIPKGMKQDIAIEVLKVWRVFDNGDVKYYNSNGQLHRIDGPAIEWFDGTKFWYIIW